MEQVQDLAKGIDPQASQDSCQIKSTANIPQYPSSMKRAAEECDTLLQPSCSKIRKQAAPLDHVPSGQSDSGNSKDTVPKQLPEPLKRLISNLPPQSSVQHSNAVETFYNCANRARVNPEIDFTEKKRIKKAKETKRFWICRLYMGDLLISSAENTSKMSAKRNCLNNAMALLFHPGLYIKDVSCTSLNGCKHTSELCINDNIKHCELATGCKHTSEPCVSDNIEHCELATESNTTECEQIQDDMSNSSNLMVNKQSCPSITKPFGNFILVESSSIECPLSTLIRSAAKNKIDIMFEISETFVKHNDEFGYLGTLLLGGKVIAQAINPDKKYVKKLVAEKAVKQLKTTCYTLQTKFHEHKTAQSNAINMESIKTGAAQNSKKITSGIGMQLMKKMGWSGEGGLGKKGQGIVEPVSVEERGRRRDGFGAIAAASTDTNALKEMVKNFAVSGREDDLVFSSELTSEQRKILHNTSQKYNLKSISYGKGESRYLIIGHKRDIYELAEYVAKNGGETAQYTLFPPQQ
ncbi:uncharacterized protein LOC117112440 isoform X2 [Anneissia japonica]|nr:uncharacterized protein LOC117112440 isoform X2 [Anneissia japonica]